MSKNIVKQLKNLKHSSINPREEWVVANRATLLAQMSNTVPVKNSFSFWKKITDFFVFTVAQFSFLRPIAALVLVGIVTSSTWNALASAALDAVPGDLILYPVKRVAEKTQVEITQLVGTPQDEIRLHTELAGRRIKEIQKITSNQLTKNEVVKQSVSDLNTELGHVRQNLEKIQSQSGGGEATIAAGVALDKTSIEIQNVLNQFNENQTVTSSEGLSNQLNQVNNLAKDTAFKAVEVALAKHLSGDGVTRDQVNTLVGSTLETAVKDINFSKNTITSINVFGETLKNQVNNEIKNAPQVLTSTSTNNQTYQIDDLVKSASEALVAIDKKINQAVSSTQEARNFISTGDIVGIVNSLKGIHQTVKEAEQLSVATQVQAQLFAPIAQASLLPVNVTSSLAAFTSSSILLPTTTTLLNTSTFLIHFSTDTFILPTTTVQVIIPISSSNTPR